MPITHNDIANMVWRDITKRREPKDVTPSMQLGYTEGFAAELATALDAISAGKLGKDTMIAIADRALIGLRQST